MKIITLIVLISFLFTGTLYASGDMSDTLRLGLMANDAQEFQRLKDTQAQEILKDIGEPDVGHVEPVAYAYQAVRKGRYNRAYTLIMKGLLGEDYVVNMEIAIGLIKALIAHYGKDTEKGKKLSAMLPVVKNNRRAHDQTKMKVELRKIANPKLADTSTKKNYNLLIPTLSLTSLIALSSLSLDAQVQPDTIKHKVLDDTEEVVKSEEQKQAEDHYNRGLAYYFLGNYAEAIESFKEAIRLDPSYTEAYSIMGDIYLLSSNHTEAIKSYEQVIRLDPSYVKVYHNMGLAYYILDNYAKAIESYKEAIRFDPSEGCYYNMGLVYYELGNYSDAVKAFRKAVELEPRILMLVPEELKEEVIGEGDDLLNLNDTGIQMNGLYAIQTGL